MKFFNHKKYGPDIIHSEWSADLRHILWVYNVLLAYPFKHILEIGPLYGASTVAFIEALNQGANFTVTLCDVNITDHLRKLVDQSGHKDKFNLCEDNSVDLLAKHPKQFDFILIDGDHGRWHMKNEMQQLFARQWTCVMAHDTTNQISDKWKKWGDLSGPAYLKRELQKRFYCIEDSLVRKNEETERGMIFATEDHALYLLGRKLYYEMATHPLWPL